GRIIYLVFVSLARAAIFSSGNLQSHSYVVLFGCGFLIGYAGMDFIAWRRLLPVILISGICGAFLAAPVLCNQIEFFIEGSRTVKAAGSGKVWLLGMATLSSIYPWMCGTFRTIDLRNLFFGPIGLGLNYGLGFHTFIGSAGLVLAVLGCFFRPLDP